MGLRPSEVDRLTPAVFASLWKQWRAVNIREKAEGEGVDAPTDAEARAVREAELKWGSGS
jgi:hypothetical protein